MISLIELIIRQLVWWVSVLTVTLWEKDRPNGRLRRAITRKVMIRDTGEGTGHWQRRLAGRPEPHPLHTDTMEIKDPQTGEHWVLAGNVN